MVESTWLPINKRIFSHEELCADSSIRSIKLLNYHNWGKVHSWYKAVNRMPLPTSDRLIIKEMLLQPTYFAAYVLVDPWVVIFRWPSGELKYFLITAEGNLIGRPEDATWDRCYHSFLKMDGVKPRGLSIPKTVSYLPNSSWIWYQSNANYAHFLLDAFTQLAMAQEYISMQQLSGFDLPLHEETPAWQEELLQKLLFQRFIPTRDNKSSKFNIYRVGKILLPIVSQRALALDWLRDFLAKSFQASHTQDFYSKHGRLIMVTRYDNRRARIQNISAIEEMVVKSGGSLVDASNLSCSEKLAAFRNCSVSIAESSGCMNGALFAPERSQIIALTDPSVFKQELVAGAWPYFTGYAQRAQFIVGENGANLLGSPVGSSSYSLDAIKQLISEAI